MEVGLFPPLQMDCSPLCHKVNFIVFVHFPNLQITSSCTLITSYWKNRPIFPFCFHFECSLHYLDDLNLFFSPHWPFKEAANAPATLTVSARKNNLSSCSMLAPSDCFLWLFLFFLFFSLFLLHQQQRLWEEIKLWQEEFGILVEILHFLLGRKAV